jgi:hypothetical protein
MEATEDRPRNDSTVPAALGRDGTVHQEASVGTIMVVVLQELKQDRSEVSFIQHDDMAQALLASGPDDALSNRVRPG